jgi:hypothetical protein
MKQGSYLIHYFEVGRFLPGLESNSVYAVGANSGVWARPSASLGMTKKSASILHCFAVE